MNHGESVAFSLIWDSCFIYLQLVKLHGAGTYCILLCVTPYPDKTYKEAIWYQDSDIARDLKKHEDVLLCGFADIVKSSIGKYHICYNTGYIYKTSAV